MEQKRDGRGRGGYARAQKKENEQKGCCAFFVGDSEDFLFFRRSVLFRSLICLFLLAEKGQQALNGFVQLSAELLHLLPHEEALSLSCVRTLEVYVHLRGGGGGGEETARLSQTAKTCLKTNARE